MERIYISVGNDDGREQLIVDGSLRLLRSLLTLLAQYELPLGRALLREQGTELRGPEEEVRRKDKAGSVKPK